MLKAEARTIKGNELEMGGLAQPIVQGTVVQGTVVGVAPSNVAPSNLAPSAPPLCGAAPYEAMPAPPPTEGSSASAPYHYPIGAPPGSWQESMDRMDARFNQRLDEMDARIKRQMEQCSIQ
mmetsp:Transcript_7984/g.15878  ORF Transcript_7984/g.15878 Transcript_7984/m.15878 type:complete len:121 (-) Transcript_7984:195-557(-)